MGRLWRCAQLLESTGLSLISLGGWQRLDENWPDYLADVRSPFLNQATQKMYPPGSTVKPIVYWAAAALGRVDDETSWSDPGVLNLPGGMISNAAAEPMGRSA